MSSRRKGRELALQMLFQLDLVKTGVDEAIRAFWKTREELPSEDTRDFCEELVRGAFEHNEEIDRFVEETSSNWRLSRMPVVDRNVLRIAVYEMLYRKDIPTTVTINEAIDVGKKFGSEDSGAFINGILDKIAEKIPSLPQRHKDET
ncbi:MAG: transcription antitermination factor NusB [Deltaproteobacteria bacterium]|nr:transcription antitermination factor NusB [Deltaproteobacteria bacterium]